jgi:hypothetical protein
MAVNLIIRPERADYCTLPLLVLFLAKFFFFFLFFFLLEASADLFVETFLSASHLSGSNSLITEF